MLRSAATPLNCAPAHPLGSQQGKGGVKAAHVQHRHHSQRLPGWYSRPGYRVRVGTRIHAGWCLSKQQAATTSLHPQRTAADAYLPIGRAQRAQQAAGLGPQRHWACLALLCRCRAALRGCGGEVCMVEGKAAWRRKEQHSSARPALALPLNTVQWAHPRPRRGCRAQRPQTAAAAPGPPAQ